jgi:cyclic pyranopterin phosphate synthase
MELRDGMGRKIDYLRLSVTDRCNHRCIYCMPEEGVELFTHDSLLRLEELASLADRFVRLFEFKKVRLTGGEPLLRRNIKGLVAMLAAIPGLADISMTTNGALLAPLARVLFLAGLRRINVSLDSLDPDGFREVTSGGDLQAVLDGLAAARDAGFSPIKVNTVLLPGFDEGVQFVAWANQEGYLPRFIELMPHFQNRDWRVTGKGPKGAEVLENIRRAHEVVEDVKSLEGERGTHVRRYRIPDRGWTFEIIPGVSGPFCGECNRLRIDCQGEARFCLYSRTTMQLAPLLKASDERFVDEIQRFVVQKTERMLDHIGSNMFAIGG